MLPMSGPTYLFPNALDYVRVVHDNAVDNLLAGQPSSIDLGSLYRRAYAVTNETGYVQLRDRFAVAPAPAEGVTVKR